MATMVLLTLLTLTTATTVMRPVLRTITPNYTAAPIVATGGLGPFKNHCSAAWAYLVAKPCVTVYWQLLAKAMADEREKMCFEILTHVCYTCGTFGCGKERCWPCTFGMNKMGGMMEDEFNKYNLNSIYILFPCMENTPGKCILLKVDSSPGHNGKTLLMKAHFCGLYIFPCLPNATSVQQEMDINYGLFKFTVQDNLKLIAAAFYVESGRDQ